MVYFFINVLIVEGISGYFLMTQENNNGTINSQENSFCEQFSNFASGGGPIPFPDYQKCIVAEGIVEKNINVCNQLSFAEYDGCIVRLALETKNLDSCSDLQHLDKDECIKNGGIGQKNLDMCDYISDSSIKKNCISGIAIENNDLDLCNQVSDNNWCIINMAVKNNSPNMCTTYSFSDPIYKDICISLAVSEKDDLAFCEQILTLHHIDFCEKKIAIEIGDTNFCEGKNDCIREIAIKAKDLNLCNTLESGTDSCIRNVKILEHFNLDSKELCW